MLKFEFLFGVRLGALILRHSNNLSSALQHKKMSAAEGQRLVELSLRVLKKMRCDENFESFYQLVLMDQSRFGISAPSLPRKQHAPSRYEVGSSAGFFHNSPEDYYRQIYFVALDNAIEAITNRFDQPGYRVYQNLEELIVKACKGDPYSDELDQVCSFYGSDLSKDQLEVQLPLLQPLCGEDKDFSIQNIVKILSELSSSQRLAISSVWTAIKLLLVMPATNATSERSFSALRRIKTYLRSTMSQERLNNLMLLHVNKDKTDALELHQIGQDFISGREGRLRTFGNFVQ